MSKPNFRPIAPLDVEDTELERVNERLGVPTMVRTPAKATQADIVTARRQAGTPPRRQQKLTVRIPGYLSDALKQKALDQRSSVRLLLLHALQKDGYRIDPEDLIPGAGGSD